MSTTFLPLLSHVSPDKSALTESTLSDRAKHPVRSRAAARSVMVVLDDSTVLVTITKTPLFREKIRSSTCENPVMYQRVRSYDLIISTVDFPVKRDQNQRAVVSRLTHFMWGLTSGLRRKTRGGSSAAALACFYPHLETCRMPLR